MNIKAYFPYLSILAALSLNACSGAKVKDEAGQEEYVPVKLLAVETGGDKRIIYTTGVFTTDDETVLSFKNGGIISRIYVKEGDAVKKGQLLATVNLTEIDAGAQQASLAFEKAERDYKRAYQLYKDSVATLEQMQNARTGMEVARQQLKAAGFNKHYSEIRANTNGYVLQRFANEGQMAGPGMPVLRINGAQTSSWILKAGVTDKQWSGIRQGDKAVVTLESLSGMRLPATVSAKSEGVNPSTGTFTVNLKIGSLQGNKLADGMFAKAEITPGKQTAQGWTIPFDALMDGSQNKGYVFISNDKKHAKKVEVTIGELRKDEVFITSGLEDASYVIVSGSAYLRDGSKIKVQN